MKAIYPGSFDPFTYGHFDILSRAARTYDEVILLFAINPDKTPKYPLDLRMEATMKTVEGIARFNRCKVEVDFTDGLVADYVNANGIDMIVRGIRDYTDLQYELKIERFNQKLCSAETVYFRPRVEYSDISSSFVNEFVKYQKLDAVKDLVPAEIFTLIQDYQLKK